MPKKQPAVVRGRWVVGGNVLAAGKSALRQEVGHLQDIKQRSQLAA